MNKDARQNVSAKTALHKKWLFFLLTLLAGIYILYPFHDFQYYMSTGDHGRELYSYKKAMDGAIPYQDYSWLYGPFLLYYYALCYKIFGLSVQSVLLGQNLLILAVGLFVYLIASLFMAPSLSLACALWYWTYRGTEFFYSYHNIGGVLAILVTLFFTFRYLKTTRMNNIYYGFVSVTILLLIRLNMGLAILVAYVTSLILTDFVRKDLRRKPKTILYALVSATALMVTFAVYWTLIHPLPKYAVEQTFPYSHQQLAAENKSPMDTIITFYNAVLNRIPSPLYRIIFGAGAALALLQGLILSRRKKIPSPQKDQISLILAILFIFFIFSLHEFIGSGVSFRFNWAFPIFLLLMFYLIHFLIEWGPQKIFTPAFYYLFIITLLAGMLLEVKDIHQNIRTVKFAVPPIQIGNNKVYTLQAPEWIETVNAASRYIKETVPPGEKIFTFPHDSLYNFLSERDNATRQLALFAHTGIPEEQESKIIADLENNNVRWVVESSRSASEEFGMGTFGQTHCLKLADYLKKNFETAAQFGDFSRPPGWAWNHGVRILRRKPSL